jgi:hypothetical protein
MVKMKKESKKSFEEKLKIILAWHRFDVAMAKKQCNKAIIESENKTIEWLTKEFKEKYEKNIT